MLSRRSKIIIAVLVVVLLVVGAGYGAYFVIKFPENYPDKTLEIEREVSYFIEKITLPIKIAKLSAQEPDAKILMPVYGARKSGISNTWGAPRGEDRVHEGQDVFAAKGTPVFSGTPGYVVRVGNNTLGGNVIYVIGAGGRRYYYAHLDRFADDLRVGQKVGTDTVIGFVGNTGNAETTPSHLHFGVYEFREAIDPLPLITDRPVRR